MVVAEEVSKQRLRKIALKKRQEIINKSEREMIIQRKILTNEIVKQNDNILIYMSKFDEVDTTYLRNELIKLKKNVYVPKVIGNEIEFYKITDETVYFRSKYKILEPFFGEAFLSNNGVIIVPGLMFDNQNNRLGYGGGYYDKYLQNKNLYKIGICFKEFLIDKLVVSKHDVKMNLIITD